MISGTDLFLGLFNNMAIFIILVAAYGILNGHIEKSSVYRRQVIFGLVFGLFAIGCMHVKIPVADGVIVDQRNAIVVLSGVFGGPLSALLCAVMAGLYRIYLGGGGVTGGVIGVSLAAVAGVGLFRLRDRIDTVLKAFVGALAATIILLPGFLFIESLQEGWALLTAMILPYGFAVFLGIFLVGLLLAKEEFRHEAELKLKESEKRFRELFENLVDVSYRTDADGAILVMSPSAEKIFGYRPQDMLGKRMADFYRLPARREIFIDQIRREGHIENIETEIVRKDGSSVWVSTNAKLLTDGEGSYIGIEGVARDISRMRKAEDEKRNLEEQLRQSQKMEAIGTLAGGVAHDFNNILAAIIGYAEMVRDDVPESSQAGWDIREVLKAGMRAKELVKHILAFSRKSDPSRTSVQIGALLDDSLMLLRASIPKTVSIRRESGPGCGAINANPTEIQQVIMNLCTNAAQEMEETGGVISVALAEVDLPEDDPRQDPGLAPGAYLKLTVRDTGPGITKDVIDRIYDPYYTTKDVGEGSGLGLSIVHGIVTSHDGMITVESAPGQGAAFHVYFPKAEDEERRAVENTDPLPTGSERILVVDDEASVADVTRKRLERLGYRVTSSRNGREALELFRGQPNAFDLVVTDYTMPDMTGKQLARELIAIRPDVPIILCTGYSSNIDEDRAKAMGIRKFVMKPTDQAELALVVRATLDESMP